MRYFCLFLVCLFLGAEVYAEESGARIPSLKNEIVSSDDSLPVPMNETVPEQEGLSPGKTKEFFTIELDVQRAVAVSPAAAPEEDKRMEDEWDRVISEVDFARTPLSDVIKVLTEKSHLNIEADVLPTRFITLCLKDVSLENLLSVVTLMSDLAYMQEEQVIRVVSREEYEQKMGRPFAPETQVEVIKLEYRSVDDMKKNLVQLKSLKGHFFADEKNQQLILMDSEEPLKQMQSLLRSWDTPPLVTKVFSFQFVKADIVVEKISKTLTEDLGQLVLDGDTNSVTVTDTAQKISEIEQMIQDLDKLIKVRWRIQVSRIQLNEEHQGGIDWDAIVSDYKNFDILGDQQNGSPEENRLSLGTITKEDFPVLKDALDAAGQLIDLNDFSGVSQLNSEKEWGWDTMNVPGDFKDDEGFAMKMKILVNALPEKKYLVRLSPHLHWLADNRPTLEASSDKPFQPQVSAELPIDGADVIILGGLLREKEVEKTSKVPLLGDLPLFGFIFRSENRFILRTEYIIFFIPELQEK